MKKTYKVNYYFDGKGYAIVEADNKSEALDKFYDGNIMKDEESGSNYQADTVEED